MERRRSAPRDNGHFCAARWGAWRRCAVRAEAGTPPRRNARAERREAMTFEDEVDPRARSIRKLQEPRPRPSGLFDPAREYDACGVGFIADLKGAEIASADRGRARDPREPRASRCRRRRPASRATARASSSRSRMSSSREECAGLGIKLPKPGHYAVGHLFMPQDERLRAHCERVWMRIIREEGLEFLGWRSVPVDDSRLSEMVKATEPVHRQIFIGRPKAMKDQHEFERWLYLIRKVVSNALYFAYKGKRHRPLHGVAVEPHAGLQGHVPVLPGEGLLQRPVRPAPHLGDGARAPALLHQHVPVVEAGPPLPHGRPQRRDQHAARQRQLDGGAAGLGVLSAVRRPTSPSCGRSPTRASRTPPASTTRSSSSSWAATASRMRR